MIEAAHIAMASNFRFEGRLPRVPFLLGALAAHALSTFDLPDLGPIANAVAVACFFVGKFLLTTLVVKRLHDLGVSGWWAIPLVAPMTLWSGSRGLVALFAPELATDLAPRVSWTALIVSALVFGAATLVLGLIPGQRRDNRYGPDPNGLVGRTLPGLRPPY